jgi:hypothetical protein
MVSDNWVTGDHLHIEFPSTPDGLRHGGAPFLTSALRASGTLGIDESVTRITRFQEVHGGSTGRKLLLDIEYGRPRPGVPTELFVKFSRDFDDPIRDHARTQMDSEVRFARLSSAPGFPIVVPSSQFADYHGLSGSGILITERIPFGTNGIELHHHKCLDYEIPDPIGHYRTLLTALGRLAGAHHAGALPGALAGQFPVDLRAAAVGEPKSLVAEKLSRQIARLVEFAADYPGLLPENVRSPDFLGRLGEEAHEVMRKEDAIWAHLGAEPAYIGLCHWNANIDNAWFWRTTDGELHCGLLDWGCVSQMNLAMAVWGCLSGAETAMWVGHLDELLQLVCTEVRNSGGPELDPAVLGAHLQVYVALMGITWLLHVPVLVRQKLPEGGPQITPRDPRIKDDESLRAPLLMLSNALNLWEMRELDKVIAAI